MKSRRIISPSVPVDECRCQGCYQTIKDLYRIIQHRKRRLRGPQRKFVPMIKTQRDRFYKKIGTLGGLYNRKPRLKSVKNLGTPDLFL